MDQTSWGEMHDVYPLKLFNTKIATSLFENVKNSAGFYLFIYYLIIEIFGNPFLKLSLLTQIANFCLITLIQLIHSSEKLPEGAAFCVQNCSKCKYVWFNDRIGIIKLINTLMSLNVCLTDKDLSIFLDLNVNHLTLSKLLFRNYRNHYCGQYEIGFDFSFGNKAALSMELESRLHVTFSVPKRENFAGAHLQFKENKGLGSLKYNFQIYIFFKKNIR